MKVVKHIPEAQLAIIELDDGTRLTISADSLPAAESIAAATDAKVKAKKAEKDAAKAQEKADAALDKLAKKAAKAVPDILAHLNAIQFRDNAPYLPDLQAAIERLV